MEESTTKISNLDTLHFDGNDITVIVVMKDSFKCSENDAVRQAIDMLYEFF